MFVGKLTDRRESDIEITPTAMRILGGSKLKGSVLVRNIFHGWIRGLVTVGRISRQEDPDVT